MSVSFPPGLSFAAGPAATDLLGGGSRSKTKINGFAGRRARTLLEAGLVAVELRGGGSRLKTEFNGFAGKQARTLSEPGPIEVEFPGGGSRLKTEFTGFERKQARTAPEGASDIGNINRERCCKERLNCYNHLNKAYHLGSG